MKFLLLLTFLFSSFAFSQGIKTSGFNTFGETFVGSDSGALSNCAPGDSTAKVCCNDAADDANFILIPYKVGSRWRLKFNGHCDFTANTSGTTIEIGGVTFGWSDAGTRLQAVSSILSTGGNGALANAACNAVAFGDANTIQFVCGASDDNHFISGDVSLTGKPGWVTE